MAIENVSSPNPFQQNAVALLSQEKKTSKNNSTNNALVSQEKESGLISDKNKSFPDSEGIIYSISNQDQKDIKTVNQSSKAFFTTSFNDFNEQNINRGYLLTSWLKTVYIILGISNQKGVNINIVI